MTQWPDSSTNLVLLDSFEDSLDESMATPSTLSLPPFCFFASFTSLQCLESLHSALLLSPLYLVLPWQPLADCSICSSHNALLLQLHHDVINIFCSCCWLLTNALFPNHCYLLISPHYVWTSSYSLPFFKIAEPTLFSLSLSSHSYSICLL